MCCDQKTRNFLGTCAVEADEAVTTSGVQLQGGVRQKLLAVEGERHAADVDISAVGVGGQHACSGTGLSLLQLKFVYMLDQAVHSCRKSTVSEYVLTELYLFSADKFSIQDE